MKGNQANRRYKETLENYNPRYVSDDVIVGGHEISHINQTASIVPVSPNF